MTVPLDIINKEGKFSYMKKFTKWCKRLKEGRVSDIMIHVLCGLVEKGSNKYFIGHL